MWVGTWVGFLKPAGPGQRPLVPEPASFPESRCSLGWGVMPRVLGLLGGALEEPTHAGVQLSLWREGMRT